MISDALETAIIKRVDIGYELTGNDGASIAVYLNWNPIEQMFRKADFSTKYIEMRKAEVSDNRKLGPTAMADTTRHADGYSIISARLSGRL